MRWRLMVALAVTVVVSSGPLAQGPSEKIDHEMYGRIRAEALERSQIMHTLHMLTDAYGPRLTGSPNLKAASDWVVKRTTEWGLKNAHLEPGISAAPAGSMSAPRCFSPRRSRTHSSSRRWRGRRARRGP